VKLVEGAKREIAAHGILADSAARAAVRWIANAECRIEELTDHPSAVPAGHVRWVSTVIFNASPVVSAHPRY
jgi:hypothetical protein